MGTRPAVLSLHLAELLPWDPEKRGLLPSRAQGFNKGAQESDAGAGGGVYQQTVLGASEPKRFNKYIRQKK